MEIRLSQKSDVPEMKRLWKLCFGDSDQLTDCYYQYAYSPQGTLVVAENGALRAMTSLLPMETVDSRGRVAETPCVYAVATDPDFRGGGYASRLLEAAWQGLAGDGLLVVPADAGLFGFYGQRGFGDSFTIREAVLTPEQVAMLEGPQVGQVRLHAVAPRGYGSLREELLAGRPHVRYSEETLAYQEKLGLLGGGGLYALEVGEAGGCAAVERAGDTLVVKELLFPELPLAAGVQALAAAFTCRRLVVRTPAFMGQSLGGQVRPFAQARWKSAPQETDYLGLAFD